MNYQQLKAVSSEIAELSAELENRRAIAVSRNEPAPIGIEIQFDPSGLYGRAVSVLTTPDGSPRLSPDDIAFSIRMLAAKAKTGDIDFVLESLVGQATWLQAAAAALALEIDSAKTTRDRKAIGDLLLKFQATATKSLEALARIVAAREPRTV